MRTESMQEFLNAARAAYRQHVRLPEAKASLSRIFSALEKPGPASQGEGSRIDACRHLSVAADTQNFSDPALQDLVRAFLRLEPALTWRPREGECINASPDFDENHANAMIVGPGGAERCSDVWIGASLVAPNIRYPDHVHPPEETYLVLSPGEFMQGEGNWCTPGIGGTLYNPPGILHAMRSGAAPLFAFWALWAAPDGV